MAEVILLETFGAWYATLDRGSAAAVDHYLALLGDMGIQLGHPYSSAIKGSKLALRELRVRHSSSAIRVLYAFDPERQAVVITGGDKRADKRFYERAITRAERAFAAYLKQQKE